VYRRCGLLLPLVAHARRHALVVLLSSAALAGCAGEGDTGLGLEVVSEEQVQEMGVESWQRILSETPQSDNESYRQTAHRVASRVLSAAGEDPQAWEVVVFEGEEANAFALPSKIGVYEGMFDYAKSEDQLAAVIGHEIGHVQAEHSAERVNTEVTTQGALQLVSAALQVGDIGYANLIAGALGAGTQYGVLLPYSRNQELEADRIGLENMAKAGYDPQAAVELWQNMQSAGGSPPAFLSTHPAPEQRIDELQELMPKALEVYRASGSG
jgi:predicted Zn-dependent protease